MLDKDGPPSSHFSVKGELNLAFKRFFLNKITHQCWFPYVGEWMSEELWVFSIDMRVKGKALRGTEISSPFTLRSYKWTPLAHTVILAPILNRSLAWTQCFLYSYFTKSNIDDDVIYRIVCLALYIQILQFTGIGWPQRGKHNKTVWHYNTLLWLS